MDQLSEFVVSHWLLVLAFFVVLTLLLRSVIAPGIRGVKEVGPRDAVRIINKENGAVLDVRLENEYKDGHILNAVHVPLGALESRLRDLEKYKAQPVIVSCRSGQRSLKACQVLRKHGFDKVYNLAGGVMAWEKAELPLTKGK